MLPLKGIVVLDFSQFYAGPSACLRMADLGAQVIKVERPGSGDANRQLRLKNMAIEGDSLLFHVLNRNKQSYAADLKDPMDLERVKQLIARADVLVQNFRPGVMNRIGLDWDEARAINPRLVYASISGYGDVGPWNDKPGQDLLAQARAGVGFLQGRDDDGPMPTSIPVADAFTGAYLVQGVLACLLRRERTGEGGLVELSLMESVLDAQIDMIATYLRDRERPVRCRVNGGHIYNGAPYGFYRTRDGHIALAMADIQTLAEVIGTDRLAPYYGEVAKFEARDEIKTVLAEELSARDTEAWLAAFGERDVWCGEVLEWSEMLEHEGFRALDMLHEVARDSGAAFQTLRCPIRLDGEILASKTPSPTVGQDTDRLNDAFGIH